MSLLVVDLEYLSQEVCENIPVLANSTALIILSCVKAIKRINEDKIGVLCASDFLLATWLLGIGSVIVQGPECKSATSYR